MYVTWSWSCFNSSWTKHFMTLQNYWYCHVFFLLHTSTASVCNQLYQIFFMFFAATFWWIFAPLNKCVQYCHYIAMQIIRCVLCNYREYIYFIWVLAYFKICIAYIFIFLPVAIGQTKSAKAQDSLSHTIDVTFLLSVT